MIFCLFCFSNIFLVWWIFFEFGGFFKKVGDFLFDVRKKSKLSSIRESARKKEREREMKLYNNEKTIKKNKSRHATFIREIKLWRFIYFIHFSCFLSLSRFLPLRTIFFVPLCVTFFSFYVDLLIFVSFVQLFYILFTAHNYIIVTFDLIIHGLFPFSVIKST